MPLQACLQIKLILSKLTDFFPVFAFLALPIKLSHIDELGIAIKVEAVQEVIFHESLVRKSAWRNRHVSLAQPLNCWDPLGALSDDIFNLVDQMLFFTSITILNGLINLLSFMIYLQLQKPLFLFVLMLRHYYHSNVQNCYGGSTTFRIT